MSLYELTFAYYRVAAAAAAAVLVAIENDTGVDRPLAPMFVDMSLHYGTAFHQNPSTASLIHAEPRRSIQ